PHCGRGRRAWATIRSMPPALAPMPPPRRTDRMLLLVFGTGAAIGLQLGLLHAFLWHNIWAALSAFLVPALGYAAVTYTLWRWVFPRLRARTLLGGITLQVLVSLLTFAVLSALTTELIASLRGDELGGERGEHGEGEERDQHLERDPAEQ